MLWRKSEVWGARMNVDRSRLVAHRPIWATALLLLSGVAVRGASPPRDGGVDFARDVQPLLAEHCLGCHSGAAPEGDLRLSDPIAARSAGRSGRVAIVPGQPEASEVLRRIVSPDAAVRMPPDGEEPLTAEQIEHLRQWIADGAPWSLHWAFQSLCATLPPPATHTGWARNGIDHFVLARLEQQGWHPAPEADRDTLIRRLYYDLLGLPPPVEEVDAFVRDPSPVAYERLVERLLQSPHFGERWGRHWLDLAHYADSDGYESDRARPDAFLYRDWVIDACNRDLPFDQFTIEQLAGDMLPHATARQRMATGFLRQTLTNEEGGVDQEEFRVAAVFDRTETVGTVWLGLTVGCARCHDHKYDPLPQTDYYRLFAFFNEADEVTTRLAIAADDLAAYEAQWMPLDAALAARYAELAPAEQAWERQQHQRYLRGEAGDASDPPLEKDIATALEMYPEKRVARTRQRLFDYYVTAVARDECALRLRQQIESLQSQHRSELVEVRTIAAARLPRETHVLDRGEFLAARELVLPGTPAVLPALQARGPCADRLDLARWLVADDNDLTPRVVVNQVWQNLFGYGLVRTPADFGVRGEPPTHPELLDWLAARLRNDWHWSRKALIRTIVTSATYRQASGYRPELAAADPANRLLYRQNRFRVQGEIVRDLHLAVAGLLTSRIGGPSVFPPMPDDLAKLSYANNFAWHNSSGADRYRRGMYTFFKRTIPHPNLTTFDAPDANTACVERTVSNTPLQALTTLNNEIHVEAARAFARRVLAMPGDDVQRLAEALRTCVARPAQAAEIAALQRVLVQARAFYAEHPEDAALLAGAPTSDPLPADEAAAWMATVRVVLNLDEFLTRE